MEVSDSEFISIIRVKKEADFIHLKEMFLEYAISIEFDLSFQNFIQELASLSGLYSNSAGAGFLLNIHGISVGCIGIRKITPDVAVIKWFYVRPGVGSPKIKKILLESAIEWAKELGIKNICLNPEDSMASAVKVFKEAGFIEGIGKQQTGTVKTKFLGLSLNRDPVLSGAEVY
ncbi:MAG: GNAT family N-acetyltransferase [Bacteroidales bacterium]|nr:GNAT family N-acetyltransferase [Bacteroidales bacterium]